jgi:hypothetical protein
LRHALSVPERVPSAHHHLHAVFDGVFLMSRGARILRDLYAIVILGASVYFGLTGADDILNTTTIGEQGVGVGATLYGVVAAVTLYGYWRKTGWLTGIALVWAILITATATLATIVYSPTFLSILTSFLAGGLIAASVYFACRSRSNDSPERSSD